MSYDICIYRREVKEQVDRGGDLAEMDHPPFTTSELEQFVDRLTTSGYALKFEGADPPRVRKRNRRLPGASVLGEMKRGYKR
jgi:hypothetical protein